MNRQVLLCIGCAALGAASAIAWTEEAGQQRAAAQAPKTSAKFAPPRDRAAAPPAKDGENTGVGFAIPVATIERIVPQLIEKGHVMRPQTGIATVYKTDRGLLIQSLVPGGPAEQAGLRGPKVVRERRRASCQAVFSRFKVVLFQHN